MFKLIGATDVANGLTLIIANTREFERAIRLGSKTENYQITCSVTCKRNYLDRISNPRLRQL